MFTAREGSIAKLALVLLLRSAAGCFARSGGSGRTWSHHAHGCRGGRHLHRTLLNYLGFFLVEAV